jgi:superoxide reductase
MRQRHAGGGAVHLNETLSHFFRSYIKAPIVDVLLRVYKTCRGFWMAESFAVYKCQSCGNIVEVLHAGGGELVCCGQPMQLLVENTVDASREKHLPVLKRNGAALDAEVGAVPHPMEDKHYIEWIEVISGGRICRQHLHPGEAPHALFAEVQAPAVVREFCNLHGLWRTEE